MNARAWFYASSFHASLTEPKPAPAAPKVQPVEHWDGEKWITLMVPTPEVPNGQA